MIAELPSTNDDDDRERDATTASIARPADVGGATRAGRRPPGGRTTSRAEPLSRLRESPRTHEVQPVDGSGRRTNTTAPTATTPMTINDDTLSVRIVPDNANCNGSSATMTRRRSDDPSSDQRRDNDGEDADCGLNRADRPLTVASPRRSRREKQDSRECERRSGSRRSATDESVRCREDACAGPR